MTGRWCESREHSDLAVAPQCRLAVNDAVREAVFQFVKMTSREPLVSHFHEALELHSEFLLQLGNCWVLSALIEFALQLAADVPDTQVRTVRGFQ